MDITVIHKMGGMLEFAKTGVYPDYLVFSSASLKRTWRIKRKGNRQSNFLKLNGQIKFEFIYTERQCKIGRVEKDNPTTKWIIVDVMTMMCD